MLTLRCDSTAQAPRFRTSSVDVGLTGFWCFDYMDDTWAKGYVWLTHICV